MPNNRALGQIPKLFYFFAGSKLVYGGIVGGFNALDLNGSPEAICYWQKLMASDARFSPRRSLTAIVAQLPSDFTAGARAFGDGAQISNHKSPEQLALLQGEIVVDRKAIVLDYTAKGVPYPFRGRDAAAQHSTPDL